MFSMIVLLFTMIAATVSASTVAAQGPVFKITKPGYYQISSGKLIAVQVIDVDGPVIPPIDDPVPPPIVDDASKMMSDLVKALPENDTRHKNSIKFAGTLKLLADQANERQLAPDAIIGVYPPMMAMMVPDDNWKPIHSFVLAGLKKCTSSAVCVSLLEKFSIGAMITVPNKSDPKMVRGVNSDEIASAAEEYGFDWKTIMDILLPLLMKLLMEWLSYVQFAAALLC